MNELFDKPDYLIVGAGLTGSILAQKISTELNAKVLILEKKDHIAGNCYDYIDKDTGILVNKYGERIFHTNNKDIWTYINKFGSFKHIQHKVKTKFNDDYITLPINVNSINKICDSNIDDIDSLNNWLEENTNNGDSVKNSEDYAISIFGKKIYNDFIKPYITKKYKIHPSLLHKKVLDEIKLRHNNKELFFDDKFVGVPVLGYTNLIRKITSHKNIKIFLNVDFTDFKNKYNLDGIKIIYTGPIDSYFINSSYDKLDYIHLEHTIKRTLYNNKKYIQEHPVIHYINDDIPYFKCVEYKYFLNQRSPHSILISESISDNSDNPLLPIPTTKNLILYEKYKKLAELEENVYFIGMLTNYEYISMAETIEKTFKLFNDKIKPCYENKEIVSKKLETKSKNILVIARFKENLDWIKQILDNKYIDKIFIYNKGPFIDNLKHPKIKIQDCLNIGREGGTYLDYIIFNYHNLPENIWFLKADPFKHNPNFLELMKEDIINKYIDNNFQTLTTRYKENIPPAQYYNENNIFNFSNKAKTIKYFINKDNFQLQGHSYFFDDNHDKNVYQKFKIKYNNESILNYLCKFIGIGEPENEIIEYTLSACFFVKSKQIKRFNLSVFKNLRTFLYETDSQGSFQSCILERFWGFFFSNKSYENIQSCYNEYFNPDDKFLVSFDQIKKQLYIAEFKEDFIKISENKSLLIKKNNKLFTLPNLSLKMNSISIPCSNLSMADEFYETKKWKKPLAIVLRGHVRDAFSNNLLKNFITEVLNINKDIRIFIHTWVESEPKYSSRQLNGKNIFKVDEKIIKSYFGENISEKISKLIIDDDNRCKIIGDKFGNIAGIPKIGWKFMWYGKYKIFDYVDKEKWYSMINLRFDLFNIKNSWSIGINTNSAYLFTSLCLTNNQLKIKFFKDKMFDGVDNIYFGTTKNVLAMASVFHKKLDLIAIKYNFVEKQEHIVYIAANQLCGNTPEKANLKLKPVNNNKPRKINFNSPKPKPIHKSKRRPGMFF
jgi:UDP-galactopyranose mutase